KAERAPRLGGDQSGFRLEGLAVEHERPVVIGEAEHGPVAPRQPPAMAQRGDAAVFRRGGGDHSNTSTSGMDGICPAPNLTREAESRSQSKRTGTSNEKPAVTAAPAAGAAASATSPVRQSTAKPSPASSAPSTA